MYNCAFYLKSIFFLINDRDLHNRKWSFRYSVRIVIFSESPLVIYLGRSFAEKYRFEETGFKVWSLSETAAQAVVTFPSFKF